MINNKDEIIEWRNVNWSLVAETLRELMIEAHTVEETTENEEKN